MSEFEQKDGQKTVVAFIAGLLIGGLLVWVFSSSPETEIAETSDETGSEVAMEDENGEDVSMDDTEDEAVSGTITTTVPPTSTTPANGVGTITVANQSAGTSVALSGLEIPLDAGWVVVREYANGIPANVLGAARFNKDEGLIPTSVTLLRGTEAGHAYQVVFFNDDGDKEFDLRTDTEIKGSGTTFTAQ